MAAEEMHAADTASLSTRPRLFMRQNSLTAANAKEIMETEQAYHLKRTVAAQEKAKLAHQRLLERKKS